MLDRVWVCKDGRQLLVSQMETSHIEKCIAKILRSRKGWRRNFLERLQIELVIRSIKNES